MIHKTAIIDPKAKIFSDVEIGPYCVIGPDVEIGEKTIIQSHVNITVNAKIGKGNKIYPFVSINHPQDLKYNGELSIVFEVLWMINRNKRINFISLSNFSIYGNINMRLNNSFLTNFHVRTNYTIWTNLNI